MGMTIKSNTKMSFDVMYKVLLHNGLITPWTPEDKPYLLRGFQQTLVDQLSVDNRQLIGIEVYCAGGKTMLSAEVAMPITLAGKKVIFISPKRDAFLHFIKEFTRVYYQHTGKNPESLIYARMNSKQDLFPCNAQIYICTPYDIVTGNKATVHGALAQAGLVIVDEVHRIPHDPENETKIIGRVEPIVRKYAMSKGAKVICMTGTYGRADGKAPFGQQTPDYKVTAQQLITEGSLPPLYGYQIPIEIQVNDNEIRRSSDVIQLRFARRKLTKYLDKIADVIMMLIVMENDIKIARGATKPGGHVILVSRKVEAVEICNILNERLGRKAFVPYTADTPVADREKIQEQLKNGELLGYATVMLGVESISIPRLKYCHCVARITSENKLMQALGRVMRLPSESDADCCLIKHEAIFVDYQVMRNKVLRLCKGIRDIARIGGSKRVILGKDGNVFVNRDNFNITSISIDEQEAWIKKESGVEDRDAEEKKRCLLELAKIYTNRTLKRGRL